MTRHDNRLGNELRPVKIETEYLIHPEGLSLIHI